jgi:hypothetical protein
MGVKIQNSLPCIGFIEIISTELNIYQTIKKGYLSSLTSPLHFLLFLSITKVREI